MPTPYGYWIAAVSLPIVHTPKLFWHALSAIKSEVDLFLEVGALDADVSIAAKQSYPNLKTVAFEANPRNIQVIHDRLRSIDNAPDLEPVAILDRDGDTHFYVETPRLGRNFGTSSLLPREHSNCTRITVPGRRLDSYDFVQQASGIVAWVDVEGAALPVLRGLGQHIGKLLLLHLEIDPLQPDLSAVLKHLEDSGITAIASNEDGDASAPFDIACVRRDILTKDPKILRLTQQNGKLFGLAVQAAYRLLPLSIYKALRGLYLRHTA